MKVRIPKGIPLGTNQLAMVSAKQQFLTVSSDQFTSIYDKKLFP